MLPDAGRIQEEDARQANRHSYSKHNPALPLFAEVDAHRALTHLQPMGYERPIEVAPGVTVEFISAGHLLGSSFVLVTLASRKRILFGGDLGRYGRPVLPDPSPARAADVALVESTYGDREHAPDDDGIGLADVINRTIRRGGAGSYSIFAIGRVESDLRIRRSRYDGRFRKCRFRRQPDAARSAEFLCAHGGRSEHAPSPKK